MELRQLEIVVAVAEHLNFGRAAQALHLGQPAASQQVARLERELGVRLFDRTSRSVTLTEAGARFVAEAQQVLAGVQRARDVALAAEPRVLRVGTSSGLGAHLSRLVDAMALSAPQVTVELHGLSTQERVDRVRAGRLDVAFLRGTRRPPDLHVLPVWDDELVAVVPSGHDLARAETLAMGQLRDLPLRLVPGAVNQPLEDLVTTACAAAGFEPARLPTAGRLEDTLALIGAGPASWAVAYASHTGSIRSDRVTFVPFEPPLVMPTSCAVSPHVDPSLLQLFSAALEG